MVFHDDSQRQSFFRRQKSAAPLPPSHNNSQHVLAIVSKRKPHFMGSNKDWGSTIDVPTQDSVLEAFSKTSLLPCEVWRHQPKAVNEESFSFSIMLASNYPDCILESDHFCVLSAGFPYHYQDAFSNKPQQDQTKMKSFSQTVLDYCESLVQNHKSEETTFDLSEILGQRLKKVSGHFSLYLVCKQTDKHPPGFWAFNDPFGFMPIYHHSLIGCKDGIQNNNENATTVLSSHWDCLVPALTSKSTRSKLQLDWDVVAEYLVFGTSLGGTVDDLDRTFVQGIENFKPGSCLAISNSNEVFAPVIDIKSYTACYGACEEILSKCNDPNTSTTEVITSEKLSEKEMNDLISPLPSSNDAVPLPLAQMFAAFSSCIEQAERHVHRAALTGGGDTRLILACLLIHEKENNIIFQTHSKQKTDWQIACHLTRLFGLKHEKIRAVSNTIGWDLLQQDSLLSHLHDQQPKRRKAKKVIDKHKEDVLSYTLHGRFGTEFLGCLCYDKSPLDLRTVQEIEDFRPKATKWFEAMFRLEVIDDNGLLEVAGKTTIRNPIDTLVERFHQLNDDHHIFATLAKGDGIVIGLDAGFAFQLQLYTRSFLCDIYKGLRGGSWFSMPIAQFTRNAITPFLDNTLLRLLLCSVSETEKLEPYELYGKLYMNSHVENSEASRILGILRNVPSNNKLLCNHTTIPRAMKASEATTRPFFPKSLYKKSRRQQLALENLQKRFSPIYWKGATAIFTVTFHSAKVKMDPKLIEKDPREEVRALVELLGSAEEACLLSGRLQSFLLWYERRFLVHLQ